MNIGRTNSLLDSYVLLGFEGDGVATKTAKLLNRKLISIKSRPFNDTSSHIKIDIEERLGLEHKKVCLIAGNCQKEGKTINDTTMEICFAINAAKQAGAAKIYLYLPYLGYARQDKVSLPGESLSASLVLQFFSMAGANKITVLDIHNEAIFGSLMGTSAVGVNHFAMQEFANKFKEKQESGVRLENLVVVAPDQGAVERGKLFLGAMKTAGFANVAFASFDKSRDYSQKGHVQAMHLKEVELPTGEMLQYENAQDALKGKTAIIIDDIVDTGGTLLKAVSENIVKRYGAEGAYAVITHGVLSGNALEKIAETEELKGMLITDSIPLRRSDVPSKLEVISCAPVFAEAIQQSIESD
ncbi:ribose-phosphate diphosphokinase [Candidatus Protochlamydia phocaeensis]|uniref:ribose-phosphate diphosphokinase n=1 Tax=Candidatus Protochlamydia phocaeensis TaxID=1414722 RepID=UPI000837C4D7|nr:ribose-phosphate diphosphokinase [Candidatus Protochlamydia phocaeensis]